MDKAAVQASGDLLARAKAAMQDMESAETLTEVTVAWSDFLTATNRVFTKLEQGAKSNGTSRGWFGLKKHERRTNPLLRYIHHARNADEHGLVAVTEQQRSGLALGVGPGMWGFDGTPEHMKVTALGGQIPGKSKFLELTPAKVRLIRVFDRGTAYDPPTGDQGEELSPLEAAKLAIDGIEAIIGEARQLPE